MEKVSPILVISFLFIIGLGFMFDPESVIQMNSKISIRFKKSDSSNKRTIALCYRILGAFFLLISLFLLVCILFVKY